MTGPEHYVEAERLMHDPGWDDAITVAQAQVHATLALVAATLEHVGPRAPMAVAWSKLTRR